MSIDSTSMKSNLNWLKEIDIDDLLEGDAALIKSQCGIETLIALWENLTGLNLYVSGKPLKEAQKRYIKKFYNGKNTKELALKLNVSERFVQKVIQNKD